MEDTMLQHRLLTNVDSVAHCILTADLYFSGEACCPGYVERDHEKEVWVCDCCNDEFEDSEILTALQAKEDYENDCDY
jgi:hypothetical protein